MQPEWIKSSWKKSTQKFAPGLGWWHHACGGKGCPAEVTAGRKRGAGRFLLFEKRKEVRDEEEGGGGVGERFCSGYSGTDEGEIIQRIEQMADRRRRHCGVRCACQR